MHLPAFACLPALAVPAAALPTSLTAARPAALAANPLQTGLLQPVETAAQRLIHTVIARLTAPVPGLPEFFSRHFLGNPLSAYLAAILILLAAILLRKALGRLAQFIVRRLNVRDESAATRLSSGVMPGIQWLIVALGFSAATSPLLLTFGAPVAAFLGSVGSTLYVIVLCVLLAGIATAFTEISHDLSQRRGHQPSAAIHNFYRRSIQVAAVILGLFMFLRVWGFDISSLLAGLGIGGLALSLAAQDTFANLLGGITIMADRVFEIGDYISTPDIEGIVEEIGFRSSRIRTFTQAVVTVPNGKLSNSFITNFSRMGKRRVRFFIPIANSTPPETLEQLTVRLREAVASRERVFADGLLVSFENLNAAALNVLVQCFVDEVEYSRFLAEQQAILMLTLACLRTLGVEFAYPTPAQTPVQVSAPASGQPIIPASGQPGSPAPVQTPADAAAMGRTGR